MFVHVRYGRLGIGTGSARSLSPANRIAYEYDSLNDSSSDAEKERPRRRVGVQIEEPSVLVGRKNDERVVGCASV